MGIASDFAISLLPLDSRNINIVRMDCNSRGRNQLRAVTKWSGKWFVISVESKTFPHNSVILFPKGKREGFLSDRKTNRRIRREGAALAHYFDLRLFHIFVQLCPLR